MNAIYDINLKASTTAAQAEAAKSKAKNGLECAEVTVKKEKEEKRRVEKRKMLEKRLCVYFQSNFQAVEIYVRWPRALCSFSSPVLDWNGKRQRRRQTELMLYQKGKSEAYSGAQR